MKLLDLIIICVASYCLLMASHETVVFLFKDSNSWIPEVFSDVVTWHTGSTFHWGVASVVTGFLLARFATNPVPTAFLVAISVVTISILPAIMANGFMPTMKEVFSTGKTALKYLQILGLLPVMTWLISLMKAPEREQEVFRNDR